MQITCPSCEGTKLINGLPCQTCKGITGESVGKVDYKGVHGLSVSKSEQVLKTVADVLDKVNDIKEKCDEIMAKLNEP